ncbi:hypothetical protein T492DRAFT_843937 [Pavlovales sp. CCMP2436]|nr:hypothetical protein T492DRAFT_843937 [Pavlovales sp. CCMP2436]
MAASAGTPGVQDLWLRVHAEHLRVRLCGVHILVPDACSLSALVCDSLAYEAEGTPRVDCVLVVDVHSALSASSLRVCARLEPCVILATEPMAALFRAELCELEYHAFAKTCDVAARRARPANGAAPPQPAALGPDCIARIRARLTPVVHGQRLAVGELTLCASSCGGLLGACSWSLRTPSGFEAVVLGPTCEPAHSRTGVQVRALAADPLALRSARVLVLPRNANPCGGAVDGGAPAQPQQPVAHSPARTRADAPAHPPAFVSMVGLVYAALCAADAALEPLVVLSLAHGGDIPYRGLFAHSRQGVTYHTAYRDLPAAVHCLLSTNYCEQSATVSSQRFVAYLLFLLYSRNGVRSAARLADP